jgi:hypothetical protein
VREWYLAEAAGSVLPACTVHRYEHDQYRVKHDIYAIGQLLLYVYTTADTKKVHF